MEEQKEFTDEELLYAEQWIYVALAIGYNEIIKQQTELGHKVFFRMLRDKAENKYVSLGGTPLFEREPGIIEVTTPDKIFTVSFPPEDIELMREAVRKFDEEKNG